MPFWTSNENQNVYTPIDSPIVDTSLYSEARLKYVDGNLIGLSDQGGNIIPGSYNYLAYDNFGRADGLLLNSVTSSGHFWNVTGPGAPTASVTDGRLVSSSTLYAYLDTGTTFPRIDMSFSFVLGAGTNDVSISPLIVLVDNALSPNNLVTMLHLLVSPTTWTLQRRVNGGDLDPIESGTHVLLTGVRYSIGIEKRSSTTVRLHLPDGTEQDVTDATFANMTWRFPGWEIDPSANSLVPRIEAVTVGHQWDRGILIASGAADVEEVAFLKGERLTLRQKISFTTPATVGYYRIALRSGWSTFEMAGRVRLSARDGPGRSQYQEVLVKAFGTTGALTAGTIDAAAANLTEVFSHRTANGDGGPAFTKMRLSTTTGSFLIYLDLYLANAEAAEAVVEFEGPFTPVPSPVVGAVAGTTASVELTFS